jgi:hypothetical protein
MTNTIHTLITNTVFVFIRCQIFLKGQQVSEHTGYGKNKTRNFAAVDILFHLYEKNDVVRVSVWNEVRIVFMV